MLLASYPLLLSAAVAADFLSPRIGLASETYQVAEIYWNCVLSKSAELEVSGEAADLVATAAFSACDDEKTEFVGHYVADVIMASSQRNEQTNKTLEQFDDALKAGAIEVVVKMRAERNRRAD